MPAISRFYGIVITMYFLDRNQHSAAHFHAAYGDHHAVFSIPDADVLAGTLPRKQRRLVQAWAELYREELLENWDHASEGRSISTIPGL